MTHRPLILSNDEIVETITVQECMDIVEKLFGDEFYSSAKLEALGFRAERTLKDW